MKAEAQALHQVAEEEGAGRREPTLHVLHEHHQFVGLGARLDLIAWRPPNVVLLRRREASIGEIRKSLLRYPGSFPVAGDLAAIIGWLCLGRHCVEIGSGAKLD